jgi:hypothetical protein
MRQQARHARVYLVGVCDYPDKRTLCFHGCGSEAQRLFFTPLQLVQEPQKMVGKRMRRVVLRLELTADSLAKRAITGGPFCKLNRRQEHALSPLARPRLGINCDQARLVPSYQPSTEFGFATIVGSAPYVERQWRPIGVPGLENGESILP